MSVIKSGIITGITLLKSVGGADGVNFKKGKLGDKKSD